MKKPAAILVCFLLIGLIVGLFAWQWGHKEPSFQERSLSEWLASLDRANPTEQRERAVHALRQMGTNTLPYLMQRLTANPSELERIGAMLPPPLSKPFEYADPSVSHTERLRAVNAFAALGAKAAPAIPKLIELIGNLHTKEIAYSIAAIGAPALPSLAKAAENENPFVRIGAARALGSMVGPADGIIPILMALTDDEDDRVRASAVEALGKHREQPAKLVPRLLALAREDPSPAVRWTAIQALGQFGAAAQPAVPFLKTIAESEDDGSPFWASLQAAAENALDKIQ